MEQVIIQEKDFQKARSKIKEAKKGNKMVVFSSADDELNRKVLEKEDIDILLLSLKKRHDKLKQRDSGFNQVLAKLAKKNKVALGIDLDEIISSIGKEKSDIIGRVRQNIKLANKSKIKMTFISKHIRNTYNIHSLGLVLGMPTWMTKSLSKPF